MKILTELPKFTGKFAKNIISNVSGRNMVFLPITKRAILQYCTKFLVKTLKVSKKKYKAINSLNHVHDLNFIMTRQKLEPIRVIQC